MEPQLLTANNLEEPELILEPDIGERWFDPDIRAICGVSSFTEMVACGIYLDEGQE